ncbi:MAG: TRAP transporter substrate-binding protein [Burkholderiales bacterium]
MKSRFPQQTLATAVGVAFAVAAIGVAAQAGKAPADIPAITLKVADAFPPTGFVPERKKNWAEYITKRTDGKVKFQFFWSESLFKQTDGAVNLAAGVADFSNVSATYDPAQTQLWMTLDMPFNAKDYWCGIRSSTRVQQEEPNLANMFQRLGFMPVVGYSSGHFQFLSKKPVEKLSDLQNKRLRSYGGARINMYKPLGISPIFMPYGQIYEAVERGVVDGAEATVMLTDSFKHYEVAKNFTATLSGMAVAAPLSINLKRWNSFPESLKQIFRDAAVQHDMEFARLMIEGEAEKLKDLVEKHGMRIIKLSDADTAALEKAGKDAQEAWLGEMEKKGVPARATWNEFQRIQRECEQEVAAKGYPWQKK